MVAAESLSLIGELPLIGDPLVGDAPLEGDPPFDKESFCNCFGEMLSTGLVFFGVPTRVTELSALGEDGDVPKQYEHCWSSAKTFLNNYIRKLAIR